MSTPAKGRVVVLGSCSVDYTCYAERLPAPGETVKGYKFTTTYGGKGANQCVAACNFGGDVSMMAKVGCDAWGYDYIKRMKDMGISTGYMFRSMTTPTGTAHITVSKSGENQIVVIPGANKELFVENFIPSADVLICQLETPVAATLRAFKLFEGIKILNAAPAIPDLDKELLELTTILCVNETEAEVITGETFDSLGLAGMLKELLETGCETAIITLGAKGAAFATQDEPEGIHVECDAVTPVDTTGAGDAFVGALGTLLSCKDDIPLLQIVAAACKAATMSVTKEGTQTSYPKLDIWTLLGYKYHKLASEDDPKPASQKDGKVK